MISKNKLTIFILAGGKSRRMGVDKGLMPYQGHAMIYPLIQVAQAFSKTLVICSNNPDYQQFGFEVIPDTLPNKGPLGGIYSALKYSKTAWNLILPCDSPKLHAGVLNKLIEEQRETLCLCRTKSRRHPLVGIYHRSLLSSIEERIHHNQLSVLDWAEQSKAQWLHFQDESTFANMNTPNDLKS